MKPFISIALSLLIFSLTLFIGVPILLPTVGGSRATPPNEQQQIEIQKGQLSKQLLQTAAVNNVMTEPDVSSVIGKDKRIAIFPPELTFPQEPDQPADVEKEIARDQRVVLLENQIRSLQTEISLLKESASKSFGIVEAFMAALISLVGMVVSAIVTHITDALLKKHAHRWFS